MSFGLTCRTHEQSIDRKISEATNKCPTITPNIVTPACNTEMATAQQDQSESAGDGGYQTAVIAVLAIALLGTAIPGG